jgi:DNA-binding NarL/FixJ family response regulator
MSGLDDLSSASPSPASSRQGLTDREIEVLCLIANGRSNKEIAAELRLSIRTVERHINNLYRKIDAQNKADATAFAIRHDLV